MTEPGICHWCGKEIDKAKPWEQTTSYVGNFPGVNVEVCHKCAKYIDRMMSKRFKVMSILDDEPLMINAENVDAEKFKKIMSEPRPIFLDTVNDPVNHPSHYIQGGIETIDVIEAWELDYLLGNCVKYISRAGKKDPSKTVEDLKKARWYLDREIAKMEAQKTVSEGKSA